MLAFLFSGQGSQYPGMGEAIYNEHTEVRQLFEQASDELGINMEQFCFRGEMSMLTNTQYTQPLVYLIGYAHYQVFTKMFGEKPKYSSGFSLGEITALAASGAFTFSDGLKIAYNRGRFMHEQAKKTSGSMLAVSGLDSQELNSLIKQLGLGNHSVVIACYNGYKQFTVSGTTDDLEQLEKVLLNRSAKVTRLKVDGAFHSVLMEPAQRELSEYLKSIQFTKLSHPVISNTNALPYASSWVVEDILTKHITKPVLWTDIMKFYETCNTKIVVEMGPGNTLRNLARKNLQHIKAFSMDNSMDVQSMKKYLKQLKSDRDSGSSSINLILNNCLAEIISAKNTKVVDDEYYRMVIKPYEYLRWLKQNTMEKDEELSKEETMFALKLVQKSIAHKSANGTLGSIAIQRILKDTGLLSVISPNEVQVVSELYRQEFQQ